jgi:hypothetical protein
MKRFLVGSFLLVLLVVLILVACAPTVGDPPETVKRVKVRVILAKKKSVLF